MRNLIDLVVLLALLLGTGYQAWSHWPAVSSVTRALRHKLSPCSSPITYSIGAVDPRFSVTPETVAEDLKQAEGVWNGPARRKLFEYVPAGGHVTVNLVYDNRQMAVERLKAMGLQYDRTQASYDELKAKYDALIPVVDAGQAAHKAKVAQYKKKEAVFNARAARWNKRGGTPADLKWLKNAKAARLRDIAAIKDRQDVLNAQIDNLNALATSMNNLIVQLKLNVAQYNRAGSSMGRFEQGFYKISGGLQSIDIYEFADRPELVRVLAHELGHALGLEHVNDQAAVMYQVNSGKDLKINGADRAELDRVCSSGL